LTPAAPVQPSGERYGDPEWRPWDNPVAAATRAQARGGVTSLVAALKAGAPCLGFHFTAHTPGVGTDKDSDAMARLIMKPASERVFVKHPQQRSGGFVLGASMVPRTAAGAYFEVTVDKVRTGSPALGIGFTDLDPSEHRAPQRYASECRRGWLVGYGGFAFRHGVKDFVALGLGWKPDKLCPGDSVGAFVHGTGCLLIFVNRELVSFWNAGICPKVSLWPFLDLDGHVEALRWCPVEGPQAVMSSVVEWEKRQGHVWLQQAWRKSQTAPRPAEPDQVSGGVTFPARQRPLASVTWQEEPRRNATEATTLPLPPGRNMGQTQESWTSYPVAGD